MSHQPEKCVLVAGASGTVGQAAAADFEALGDWQVLAVSRRPPEHAGTGRVRHISVDLRDADACRAAVAGPPPVTHLVYTALHERPELVAGWRDPGQMATNLAMLRNLVDPLAGRGGLRHVSLLQGTKAYGSIRPTVRRLPRSPRFSGPGSRHLCGYAPAARGHLHSTPDVP